MTCQQRQVLRWRVLEQNIAVVALRRQICGTTKVLPHSPRVQHRWQSAHQTSSRKPCRTRRDLRRLCLSPHCYAHIESGVLCALILDNQIATTANNYNKSAFSDKRAPWGPQLWIYPHPFLRRGLLLCPWNPSLKKFPTRRRSVSMYLGPGINHPQDSLDMPTQWWRHEGCQLAGAGAAIISQPYRHCYLPTRLLIPRGGAGRGWCELAPPNCVQDRRLLERARRRGAAQKRSA